jgi:hypothetical protein
VCVCVWGGDLVTRLRHYCPDYTQLISVGRLGITISGSGSNRRDLAQVDFSFLATGGEHIIPNYRELRAQGVPLLPMVRLGPMLLFTSHQNTLVGDGKNLIRQPRLINEKTVHEWC